MSLKIRYPDGWLPDDLEVGQQYRLEYRNARRSVIVGELQQLQLVRHRAPRLVILPVGGIHQMSIAITQLKSIAIAHPDLSNSDYRDEEPPYDIGGEGGVC